MERTESFDWTYIQELISLRRRCKGFQYLAFVVNCAPQVQLLYAEVVEERDHRKGIQRALFT